MVIILCRPFHNNCKKGIIAFMIRPATVPL